MFKPLVLFVLALITHVSPAAETWQYREWTVNGVKREALLHVPEVPQGKLMPLVFAFHGHGGNMRNSTRAFPIHELWPEALVVCMQGLPTPGRLTDPEGKKNGWQSGAGDQGDRDLKFFDAVFETLKKEQPVDLSRVYALGHSNGGGFTYLLWAERGDVFAAMAPSGSAAFKSLTKLKPKPVLHVAGETDPLVKFDWQKRMIDGLLAVNQCDKGTAWDQDANCTIYASAIGVPVVTAIHPGGHEYPKQAPAVIVKFFKQHPAAPAAIKE
jgi:polyhydroxybutyrate depolymerase